MKRNPIITAFYGSTKIEGPKDTVDYIMGLIIESQMKQTRVSANRDFIYNKVPPEEWG